MSNLKMPRFSPELPRMLITTIVYVGIGIFGLHAVSGRRILECDRTFSQVHCQLSTQQLLEKTRVPHFTTVKLHKAIVGEHGGLRRITNYYTIYTIDLVTDQGTFLLTTNEMEPAEKYRLIAIINTFLENPQIPALKVEEGDGSFFGIGIGIFSFILALLGFGWMVSWRFSASTADKTVSEIWQESWEETLKTHESHHRQEQKISPNSNTKKAPNLR